MSNQDHWQNRGPQDNVDARHQPFMWVSSSQCDELQSRDNAIILGSMTNIVSPIIV